MKYLPYALLSVGMLVSPVAAQTVIPVATNVTIPATTPGQPGNHVDFPAIDVSGFTNVALAGKATSSGDGAAIRVHLTFSNTPGSLFEDGSLQTVGNVCAVGNSVTCGLLSVAGRFLLIRVANEGGCPNFVCPTAVFSLEVFGREISTSTFPIPLPVIIAPKK